MRYAFRYVRQQTCDVVALVEYVQQLGSPYLMLMEDDFEVCSNFVQDLKTSIQLVTKLSNIGLIYWATLPHAHKNACYIQVSSVRQSYSHRVAVYIPS